MQVSAQPKPKTVKNGFVPQPTMNLVKPNSKTIKTVNKFGGSDFGQQSRSAPKTGKNNLTDGHMLDIKRKTSTKTVKHP